MTALTVFAALIAGCDGPSAAHTSAAHTGAAHTSAAHTGAAHTGAAHTGAADAGAADAGTMTPTAAIVVAEAPRVASWLPDPAARHGDGEGRPIPHHDGSRRLVVAREGGGRFVVFEEDAESGNRRVAVRHAGDCGRAAYLPDDRIVYSGTTSDPAPGAEPAESVAKSGWALFVADGLGGAGSRITFGAGLDADPYVLSDGRIVFSSWRPGRGRLGLFTVHPDGTGYAPFHLADTHAVLATQDATTLNVFAWFVGADASTAERRRVDWDAPLAAAEPDADSDILLAPRRRPQGQLSSRNEERPWGTLVCVDARSVATAGAGAVAARLSEWGAGGRTLGDAPLADDGSFMARVPVDTPLALALVDAAGATVSDAGGPFWLRHNEVRVCVSCHDDVQTGPPNRRPQAVLGDAVDLTGASR